MLITTLTQKWTIITASIALITGLLLVTSPIPQDPKYHLLADSRYWLGLTNFANVMSNLPFAIIGIQGLLLSPKREDTVSLSWQVFFTGLFFVAIGSGYYHLNPNNQSLVWDRLPMTISFMGLFIAILTENVPNYREKLMLPAAVLLGLSSVIYWHYTNDLRFYGFMQFAPLAAIPLILYLYKGQYTHRFYLIYGLAFYLLAKVFELTDRVIFEVTGQLLSGHTIKHLLAAAATYCLYLMLKNRDLIQTDQ